MNGHESRAAASEAAHEKPRPGDDYELGFDDDFCPGCDRSRTPGDLCCIPGLLAGHAPRGAS